jgi:hypothetical protein
MMVCEGCGAVCTCPGRVLQIIDLPVNQKKKSVWMLGGEMGECCAVM